MILIESMSAKVHVGHCFHIRHRPLAVYKGLFPDATEQQIREFIKARKLEGRCCGSCLAWAVLP